MTLYVTTTGNPSLPVAGSQIGHIGNRDEQALSKTGLTGEVIDVTGCVVVPGFIDPHKHLIGEGEEGFASRMPEIRPSQILTAGVTTVIGLLGTEPEALNCRPARSWFPVAMISS